MAYNLHMRSLPKDLSLAESFDVYLCNNYSLPSFAITFLQEHAASYQAREDDIYVLSYPKTGTTWLQEIVYLVQSNLDFNGANKTSLHERFPYIEHAQTNFECVRNMASPRLLKTHLPYSLLPMDILQKHCKIIYVTRNPRDVVVSYYHFAKMLKETQYQGNFEQFFERFMSDRATYSPFLSHNLEVWEKKNNSNILFLFYEDLQKDPSGNVKKVAEFLGRSLSTEHVDSIVEYCCFTNMAKKEQSYLVNAKEKDNTFFRKGKVGDWKNYFNEEMVTRLDQKVEDVLKGSDLKYTYEL